nr:hypothetical protein CFP56_02211 [Quercus suber]
MTWSTFVICLTIALDLNPLKMATSEEKVMVANSKLEFVEEESSKLRKDLIESMDETNKAKEKIKDLNEALRVEKMLVVQKEKEI